MSARSPSIGIFLGRPDRSARLAERLRARGFDVTNYNTEAIGESPFVPVAPGARSALSHLLMRTRHDVYWTGLSHLPGIALSINYWLRGKPFVFNETSLNWESFADRAANRPFPRLFERVIHPFLLGRTYAAASRIACNSHFLEARLAERYPQHRPRLTTIYNGIDHDRFRRGRRERFPGAAPGDFTLLCVTTLNFAGKSAGLDLVLDAFGRIRAADRSARLIVAAKSSTPRYPAAARARLAAEPWGHAVDLRVNEPHVPDFLASADLFLYATPPGSDSLPRALLEAQAAGLPAVATATCGCPEIVADGETGRLVPYEAAALAEAAQALMDDPARRSVLRANARESVARRFHWDRMADEYASLFLEIAV